MRDWGQLEQFARAKKSPIGYGPFASVCLEQGMREEALKYIALVPEPSSRVPLYLEAGAVREAAQAAFDAKDPQMLMTVVAPRATQPQERALINQMLTQLGAA